MPQAVGLKIPAIVFCFGVVSARGRYEAGEEPLRSRFSFLEPLAVGRRAFPQTGLFLFKTFGLLSTTPPTGDTGAFFYTGTFFSDNVSVGRKEFGLPFFFFGTTSLALSVFADSSPPPGRRSAMRSRPPGLVRSPSGPPNKLRPSHRTIPGGWEGSGFALQPATSIFFPTFWLFVYFLSIRALFFYAET